MTDAPITLDFRDSELARIGVDGDDCLLHFSVAAVRGMRQLYARDVVVRLVGARVGRHDTGCIGRVAEGTLEIDGRPLPAVLPAECTGPLALRLEWAHGARFEATAAGVRLGDGRAPDLVEYLHC